LAKQIPGCEPTLWWVYQPEESGRSGTVVGRGSVGGDEVVGRGVGGGGC
jgi:hypothetical protein